MWYLGKGVVFNVVMGKCPGKVAGNLWWCCAGVAACLPRPAGRGTSDV